MTAAAVAYDVCKYFYYFLVVSRTLNTTPFCKYFPKEISCLVLNAYATNLILCIYMMEDVFRLVEIKFKMIGTIIE